MYQSEYSDIINAGTWELPSDGYYVYESDPLESTFTNAGTGVLIKEATGFSTSIYTPFENDGLVDVDGDYLYVEGEADAAGTDAGDWDIDPERSTTIQMSRSRRDARATTLGSKCLTPNIGPKKRATGPDSEELVRRPRI